jgi:hypothetical protein
LLEAAGLCFTYHQVPSDFIISRPGLVRRLNTAGAQAVGGLPSQAPFLYHKYCSPEKLLVEGMALGALVSDKSWPFTLLKSWV